MIFDESMAVSRRILDRRRWREAANMSANIAVRPTLAVLFALIVVAASATAFGQNQAPGQPVHELQTKIATHYVFGSRYCVDCHGNPERRNDLCRMIESQLWEKRDPHKFALDWGRGNDPKRHGGFHSAAGQRAAEIGSRLGI